MSLNPRLRDWRGRRVWIVGASSGIGQALAQQLLQAGAELAVSARHAGPLQALAATAAARVQVLPLDITDATGWQRAHDELCRHWPAIDQVVFCAAAYEPVRAWTLHASSIEKIVSTNLQGTLTGVATVLPAMLERSNGAISIIASVAGYSGLPKALLYGPTKAALINFCEALYLDVHARGLAVHLINPGFVATPLTQQNDFHMPALISPQTAAREILHGMAQGRFEIHFPRRFTCWMQLLRRLPYRLRLPLLARLAEAS